MAELLGKVTGTSKGMGGSHAHFLKRTPFCRRNVGRTNSSRAGLALPINILKLVV
jgi:TPP-dependent pyruvate/acetoin dehydrogenase alpha subunit